MYMHPPIVIGITLLLLYGCVHTSSYMYMIVCQTWYIFDSMRKTELNNNLYRVTLFYSKLI